MDLDEEDKEYREKAKKKIQEIFNYEQISLEAKVLWIFLCLNEGNKDYTVKEISTEINLSTQKIYMIIKELVSRKYWYEGIYQDHKGNIIGSYYSFYGEENINILQIRKIVG